MHWGIFKIRFLSTLEQVEVAACTDDYVVGMQEETVTEEVDGTEIGDDTSNNVQIGEVVTDIEYIPIEVDIKLYND